MFKTEGFFVQHRLLVGAGILPRRNVTKVFIVTLSFSIRSLEFFAEMTPTRLLTLECVTAHQLREFQKVSDAPCLSSAWLNSSLPPRMLAFCQNSSRT